MTGRHALRTPPSLVDRAEPALRVIAAVLDFLTLTAMALAVLWLVIYALVGGTL